MGATPLWEPAFPPVRRTTETAMDKFLGLLLFFLSGGIPREGASVTGGLMVNHPLPPPQSRSRPPGATPPLSAFGTRLAACLRCVLPRGHPAPQSFRASRGVAHRARDLHGQVGEVGAEVLRVQLPGRGRASQCTSTPPPKPKPPPPILPSPRPPSFRPPPLHHPRFFLLFFYLPHPPPPLPSARTRARTVRDRGKE